MLRLGRVLVILAMARVAAAQPSPAPVPAPTPAPSPAPLPSATALPQVTTDPAATPSTPSEAKTKARLDRAMAEAACAARDPACDWLATLGSLERASMRRALAARGFTLDPTPWDKRIGKIHVYNEDVFAEGARALRFLNNFHVTSKEYIVRREVVVEAGDVWDPDRILESARRLRDPLFTSVVVVLPVQSGQDGVVDVIVVTRDIWSLRLNTQYTFQEGKLTNLSMSLSENNFLGRRKVVALGITLDQGNIEAGPLYTDKNFLGKYLELRGRVNTIVNRDAFFDGDIVNEGSSSSVSLRRLLWRLSSKWGGGGSFSHYNAIERRFDGTRLRPVHCPHGGDCELTTVQDAAILPGDEVFSSVYRSKRWGLSVSAVRQWGTEVKQQLSFGYGLDVVRPRLLDDFAGTSDQAAAFSRVVMPQREINSAPFVSYALFTPRFRTRRNVGTYDLAEDLRLGPDAEVSYGIGRTFLGSTYDFHRGGIGGGYTLPVGSDGSLRGAFAVSSRYQDGELRDNVATASLRLVTPNLRYARIVAETSVSTRWNERTLGYFTIGSDNGLRGFGINQFFGQRLVSSQVEARSIPTSFWVVRLGGVVFYEVGGSQRTFKDLLGLEGRSLELHHDVGVGLRGLFPQTSRELFRFDFAFPLDGDQVGTFRFSAGFQQEF